MSRKICIQSGHWGMTSGATGAPREQERTIAIGLRLTQLLSSIGVEAYRDDAFDDNDPKVNNTDWDLYLALHCDANYAGDEGGGFVDWIDPSIDSSVESNKESERISKAIEEIYFKESGIRNMPNRRNPNTKFYYMWNVLSEKTHCVIIEMGESIDPHDNVILNDTERQAQILLKSIQNAFPDMKPVVQPQTPQQTTDWKVEYDKKVKELEQAKTQCSQDIKVINEQKNTVTLELLECQKQRDIYKGEYDNATKKGGYKNQITLLEEQKKIWIEKETQYNKELKYWQTRYANLKKPGLKFIQDAVIRLCEKMGVELT